MKSSLKKRGEAERALKNKEDELNGYRAVAARCAGADVGMQASLDLAEAQWYYGMSGGVASLLAGIFSDYPESIWAVRSLLKLAVLQGASREAVDTYKDIIRSYPDSIFWVEAQLKLAELNAKRADLEEDAEAKKKLKKAGARRLTGCRQALPPVSRGRQRACIYR